MTPKDFYNHVLEVVGVEELNDINNFTANFLDQLSSIVGSAVITAVLHQGKAKLDKHDQQWITEAVVDAIENNVGLVKEEWDKYQEWVDFRKKYKGE